MNKLAPAALLLSLVACAGLGFAIQQVHQLNGTIQQLEDRLAKNDGAPAGGGNPATASGAGSTGSASSASSLADVASEVVKLKAELADVQTKQETLATNQATLAKATTSGTTGGTDEVAKAVDEALAKKEEERKKADEKRTQDFMARAQQGILDTLTKELGLTEQQKTQINDILTTQTAAFRDAWTNRKEGEDPRAKMTELRDETNTKIKAVLTPEQQTKYDELAKNPGGVFGGGMGGFGGGGGRRGGRGGGNNGGGNPGGGD